MSRIYMPVGANKTFKTNVKVTKSATSDNSGKTVSYTHLFIVLLEKL